MEVTKKERVDELEMAIRLSKVYLKDCRKEEDIRLYKILIENYEQKLEKVLE